MSSSDNGGPRVCVLGPTRVVTDGVAHHIRGLAARLLCHLAVSHGNSVRVDTLIDRLWDDPPATARSAIQVAVHKLRYLLEPQRQNRAEGSVLRHIHDGYMLSAEGCDVDVHDFESGLASATGLMATGSWNSALETIKGSLDLWDLPFGRYGDEPFLASEARRLEEVHMSSEETLSEIQLELGVSSIDRLQNLATAQPLREKRWEHLMIALFRAGRQSHALRAFKEAEEILTSIGLTPGFRLREVEERILLEDPSLLDASTSIEESLIGRDDDLDELNTLIQSSSVVTVVGPPGIGKSKLVESYLSSKRPPFPRVTTIDVQSTAVDPWVVIAHAFVHESSDLTEEERIALIGRSVQTGEILVLDNLPDGHDGWKELIPALAAAFKGASIIVTSHTPLGIPGESELRLAPLPVPTTSNDDDSVWSYPSVRLLADRIRGYRLDRERDTSLVADVVRVVDGHPLAIELAAKRCDDLGLADVLEELKEMGRTGSSNSIDLTEAIMAVVTKQDDDVLAVLDLVGRFVGTWTLADARQVGLTCGLDARVVQTSIGRLTAASLVEHLGEGRYTTLACVRTAIGEGRGQANTTFDRALSDLAVDLDYQLRTNRLAGALERFDSLASDFEGAMARGLDTGDLDSAWRIFGSMGGYWWLVQARERSRWWEARVMGSDMPRDLKPRTAIRAYNTAGMSGFSFLRFSENKGHFKQAVEIAKAEGISAEGALAHANLALAISIESMVDPESIELASRAVDWATASEDPYALGFAYFALAGAHASYFDFDEAVRVMNRSIGTAEEAGILSLQAFSMLMLGHLHQYRTDFPAALRAYEHSSEICARLRYSGSLRINGVYGTAEAAQLVGDINRAKPAYQEAFETMRSIGDARGSIMAAIRLARIEAEDGDRERAERLLGFATSHLRFHNEDSIRACVLIAQAHLDHASGHADVARRSLDSAISYLNGVGSPLGPIDAGLLQQVELAVSDD